MFKNLTPEELDLLVNDRLQVRFRAGETILKQNTASSHLICIRKGMAKLFVEGSRDKSLIIKILKDSDLIISGSILTKIVRPFTVTAVTETECCFINSEKIVHLLSSNAEFAVSFLEEYYMQSNHLFNTLVNLTLKYMPGKVADTLLYLKNKVFFKNPFIVIFTRQELAEMSAMTKESFVRILTEFKNSNLIKIQGRMIEIIDEQGLMELSRHG
jgi:CRP/FNR family transcriptional regulator, polysaccharide utilization system transcription regulator